MIRPDHLCESLAKVSQFVAVEHSRYAINGIQLAVQDSTIESVSTDGRRLAIHSVNGQLPSAKLEPVVVSMDFVNLLRYVERWLDHPAGRSPGSLEIIDREGGEAHALFQFFSNGIYAEVWGDIESLKFPPYEDVIPKTPTIVLGIGREEFAEAVEFAALTTSEERVAVVLDYKHGKGIEVACECPTVGKSGSTIECELLEGEGDMRLGLNPGFIIDALDSVDSDTVRLELTAPNKPVRFVDGAYQNTVMPVSIG